MILYFDINPLLHKTSYLCGRRFGKSEMYLQFYVTKLWASQRLGDLFFPEMKKKYRERLNKTFFKYICKKINEEKEND